ncbi:uncharacterized protein ATC70_011458 [Mucor velutinosus]|uniref:C2H2-type domain-containing protein n=1 Tax=Mucor velutinosus TaxID=708070 RepID=A0AAN7I0Z4_9FUNG|nr:hypothetical protein ATC70_011458 [Mucor velutinosus]
MYSNYLNQHQPSSPITYHRFRHNSDPQLAPPFPTARRMSYGDYLSYTSDSSLETSPVGSTLDYSHHQQAPSPLAMNSELPGNSHKSCCPCIHSNGCFVDQLSAYRRPLDWQSPLCNQFTFPPLHQQQQQQQGQFMMFDALPTPTIVSSQLMTPSLSSSSCSSQMHELSIYDLLELVPTQYQQQEAYCVSPPSPFVSHHSAATNDDDDQDENKQTVNEANDKRDTKASSCAAGGGKAKVKKSTRARRNDVSGVTSNDCKKYKETSCELDAKQFLCEYDDCGKLFKRSEHLKRHIKSIHTKEKPYSCPYKDCGKSFARTDNLSQHIRIHRNNKGSSTATKIKARTKA